MTSKVVTLPQREDMLRRLNEAVDNDHLRQFLYPKLLEFAGTEMVAHGIVLLLNQCFADYVDRGDAQWMEPTLQGFLPLYIDLLIDDKEASAQAKSFHEECRAAAT